MSCHLHDKQYFSQTVAKGINNRIKKTKQNKTKNKKQKKNIQTNKAKNITQKKIIIIIRSYVFQNELHVILH